MIRCLANILIAATIAGWQGRSPQVFRSSADAVPVYVSVMGRDGLQIRGLGRDDFTILDNGKPQPTTFFSADRHAFALAILLDTRAGMMLGPGWVRQMEFGQALAGALDPNDLIALGSIGRPIVQLTANKLEVLSQLRRPPGALVGELQSPEDELPAAQAFAWAGSMLSSYEGRRIAVLFTDSSARLAPSTSGLLRYANPSQVASLIIKESERADLAFHIVGFDDSTLSEEFLRAFSGTGGGASLVTRDADFKAAARDFVEELHNEYLLAFSPAQLDGKSHKLTVRVNRPNVKVRARVSYIAPKS